MPPKEPRKKSFRWGHRRTNSTPIQVEHRPPVARSQLAIAAEKAKNAAAAAGPRPPRVVIPEPTAEEEVEGLTNMTMIGAEDAVREVSYSNAALPKMMYEPSPNGSGASSLGSAGLGSSLPVARAASSTGPVREPASTIMMMSPSASSLGGGVHRTLSDPGNLHMMDSTNIGVAGHGILAYWKLEKELRLAQDSVLQKNEEVAKMEEYKRSLTMEMDELTTTLFEEAHEMVRIEKEARHKDHVLLEETRQESAVMMEELKALKQLVASHAKDEKTMTRRASAAQLQNAAADAPEASSWPVDAVLFNEFMKWHIRPSLAESSEYMKRVVAEDIWPCLNFNKTTQALSKALLHCIKENTLMIEGVDAAGEQTCAFSQAKRACPFRLKAVEPLPEGYDQAMATGWLTVCSSTRNRVICVANFYTYARYVVQGIVKANLTVTYWKLNEHRLSITKSRLGMPLE